MIAYMDKLDSEYLKNFGISGSGKSTPASISEDSLILTNIREQIEAELNKHAEEIREDDLVEMHTDSSFVFLNFYAKAMNPPEAYLEALDLVDLPRSQAYANVSGHYKKYCESHNSAVILPRFDAGTWNPLNDYKNVRERASRSGGNFFDTLWSNKLSFVKPTFPEEISEAYAESDNKKKFRERCWDTLQDFFHKLQDEEASDGQKLGMHANLHLWKTEKPFKPHLHFHCAIPMLKAPYVTSDDRQKVLNSGKTARLKEQYDEMPEDSDEKQSRLRELNNELADDLGVEKMNMHDYRKGHVFDAGMLRALWKEALEENWASVMDNSDIDEVNVHVSWASKHKNPEKVMHKFRYKSRTPTIDFFHYYQSNEVSIQEYQHKDFMEHVFWYDNSARVYGYMKWGTNLQEYDTDGLMHRCPICGSETRDIEDDDFNDISGRTVVQEERYGYKGYDPPDDSDVISLFH